MRGLLKICAVFVICLFIFSGASYSTPLDMALLVDSFQKATDIQKDQILKDNVGKEIQASGKVSNAGEYDFFDIVNDIKGTYYQVSTEQQKTKNNTPYQVIFLFKDREKVEGLDRGQNIVKDGKIVRITDERLQISVWLLCADLTNQDKSLIKQD